MRSIRWEVFAVGGLFVVISGSVGWYVARELGAWSQSHLNYRGLGPFESSHLVSALDNWMTQVGLVTNPSVCVDIWIVWERAEVEPILILQSVQNVRFSPSEANMSDYDRIRVNGLLDCPGGSLFCGDRSWLGTKFVSSTASSVVNEPVDTSRGTVDQLGAVFPYGLTRTILFWRVDSMATVPDEVRRAIEDSCGPALFGDLEDESMPLVRHATFTAPD